MKFEVGLRDTPRTGGVGSEGFAITCIVIIAAREVFTILPAHTLRVFIRIIILLNNYYFVFYIFEQCI